MSRTNHLNSVIEYANNNPNIQSEKIINFKDLDDFCSFCGNVEEEHFVYNEIITAKRPDRSFYKLDNTTENLVVEGNLIHFHLTKSAQFINSIKVEGEIDSFDKFIIAIQGMIVYEWPINFFEDRVVSLPLCSYNEPLPLILMRYSEVKIIISSKNKKKLKCILNYSKTSEANLDNLLLENSKNPIKYPIYGINTQVYDNYKISYSALLSHICTVIKPYDSTPVRKLSLIYNANVGGCITCFGQQYGGVLMKWCVANIVPTEKYGGYLIQYSKEIFHDSTNAIHMAHCESLNIDLDVKNGIAHHIYANVLSIKDGMASLQYHDEHQCLNQILDT